MDARQLRGVLGQFTTGVAVVTAAGEEPGSARGMTANAFTSVSLRPPLVLVSVATSARMNGCIERAGHYGVSVLAHDQEPEAARFAGRPGAGGPSDEPVRFRWWDGVPLLPDALMHLTCAVYRSVRAGDHTLFLGEVRRVGRRGGRPLVFYGGRFRRLETPVAAEPWWL